MSSHGSLVGFIIASLIVLVMPGPGVLYVVTRSVSQGQRAGLMSVLGLSAGALVHVLAAAVGLSTLLLTSATAFGVIKTLGAGYLVYLGIRTIARRNGPAVGGKTPAPRGIKRVFRDGVMVSVLNPKIAVFFLAFLPQFVGADRGSVPVQVLVLGLLYVALALCTDGVYALLASRLRGWLGSQAGAAWPRYASGSVYIGLGVQAALADKP